MIRSESMGFPGSRFCFVVEAFSKAAGNKALLTSSPLLQLTRQTQRSFCPPILADASQLPGADVNPVTQGQRHISALPGDFVDPDCRDTRQILVHPGLSYRRHHQAVYMSRSGAKHNCNLATAQSIGPARRKPGLGLRQFVLACFARHPFHFGPKVPTYHSVRGVKKEHLAVRLEAKFELLCQ